VVENWVVVIGLTAALGFCAVLGRLGRRVQSLEHQMSALQRHLGLTSPPLYSPSDRVKQLAADPKRKIEAIKAFREESGLGLREAKTIVEELIESQRMNLPSR
jgi:ribosomal protein L7/L12